MKKLIFLPILMFAWIGCSFANGQNNTNWQGKSQPNFSIGAPKSDAQEGPTGFQADRAGGVEVHPVGYFNGLYVGAYGAVLWVNFRHNVQVEALNAAGPRVFFDNVDADDVFGMFGLDAGYGHQLSRVFYLGVDFDFAFNNRTVNFFKRSIYTPLPGAGGGVESVAQMTLQNLFAMSLKPGFLLTPGTLLFAEVGIARTTARFNTTATFFAFPLFLFPIDISVNAVRHKALWGYRVGVGIEQHLTHGLSLKLAYLYTGFPGSLRRRVIVPGVGGFAGNSYINDTKVRVGAQQLEIGLNYYFLSM